MNDDNGKFEESQRKKRLSLYGSFAVVLFPGISDRHRSSNHYFIIYNEILGSKIGTSEFTCTSTILRAPQKFVSVDL